MIRHFPCRRSNCISPYTQRLHGRVGPPSSGYLKKVKEEFRRPTLLAQVALGSRTAVVLAVVLRCDKFFDGKIKPRSLLRRSKAGENLEVLYGADRETHCGGGFLRQRKGGKDWNRVGGRGILSGQTVR